MNVGVQRLQARVFGREQHQLGAQVHQKFDALAEFVELAQEFDPRRDQSLAQITLGAAPFILVCGFLSRRDRFVHGVGRHVVFLRQYLQEAPSSLGVQNQVGLAQIRRAGAGRYLATTGFQASVDLPSQTIGVGIRQLRRNPVFEQTAAHAAQTPGAAESPQGAIQYAWRVVIHFHSTPTGLHRPLQRTHALYTSVCGPTVCDTFPRKRGRSPFKNATISRHVFQERRACPHPGRAWRMPRETSGVRNAGPR
jgi:hypothetical protein